MDHQQKIEMLANMQDQLITDYGPKLNKLIMQFKIAIQDSIEKEKQMQVDKYYFKQQMQTLLNKNLLLQNQLQQANNRIKELTAQKQKNQYTQEYLFKEQNNQEYSEYQHSKKQPQNQMQQIANQKNQGLNNGEKLAGMLTASPVPVDIYYSKACQSVVYQKEGLFYSATLSQTNLALNNNKFYIIQIIKGPNYYILFRRWGRVGVPGQISEETIPSDINSIIEKYFKIIKEKIKIGYKMLQINYSKIEKEEKKSDYQVPSQLAKPVKDLMELIFDVKSINNQMREIGYDEKKMPVDKLSIKAIQRGYQILKNLMQEVRTKKRSDIISQYTMQFYSQIPHDFGFGKIQTFMLDSELKIKSKLQMLYSLSYCHSYAKIFTQKLEEKSINIIDFHYSKLQTSVSLIDEDSEIYQKLVKYANTFASTHNSYELSILDIFSLEKEEENLRFKHNIPNKQLLWHGSRLCNFVGILSEGLVLPPPESPVEGYNLGKGIYFTDAVSKAANLCFASRANNIALILLCEVALGDCWEKKTLDYYSNCLPPDRQSTKGLGRMSPISGEMIGGIWAPSDKLKETGITDTNFLYNQYVVYDTRQVKMKFLFKVRLDYKE